MELTEFAVLAPDKVLIRTDSAADRHLFVPVDGTVSIEDAKKLRGLPRKRLWVGESSNIVVDKQNATFWTLDLVPNL
jgi:hypothetical protein